MYSATKTQPLAGHGNGSVRTQNQPAWPESSSPAHSSSSAASSWSGRTTCPMPGCPGSIARESSCPVSLHNGAVPEQRDVGIVLSGGGMNAVLMELGFLRRVHESPLWPRIAAIFGTSAGALVGSMAALDRLDELESFLLELRAEETFRPNRLWRLPLLGFHDYALPRTVDERLGDQVENARRLREAPIELVVVATDVTGDEAPDASDELELVYSSRTADPEVFAQAVLGSAAVSGLVLPVPVGDRLATDGGWVRNYPLAHAYDHPEIELIVAFRHLPRYPRAGFDSLERLRRRVKRLPPVPPVKALLAELDEAEERGARGEPVHLVDMISRLMRVTLLRNTALEERRAEETDASIRELESLRRDLLAVWTRACAAGDGSGCEPRSRPASRRRASRSGTSGSCRGSPCSEPSAT